MVIAPFQYSTYYTVSIHYVLDKLIIRYYSHFEENLNLQELNLMRRQCNGKFSSFSYFACNRYVTMVLLNNIVDDR